MKLRQLIYYLDDDVDDLFFFKEAAETLGHDVITFVNGQEMLRTLSKKPFPDIIFLDVRMPVFEGEEILQVIKKTEESKNIPVVMISGSYPKSVVQHYLDSGANYMMKKPDFGDMKSALEYVLKIDWDNFHAYN